MTTRAVTGINRFWRWLFWLFVVLVIQGGVLIIPLASIGAGKPPMQQFFDRYVSLGILLLLLSLGLGLLLFVYNLVLLVSPRNSSVRREHLIAIIAVVISSVILVVLFANAANAYNPIYIEVYGVR